MVVGKKFGRWTVVEKLKNGRVLCICECGTEKSVNAYSVRKGQSKSCGCIVVEKTKAMNDKKLYLEIGKKFGKLTVIAKAGVKNQNQLWLCKCDCGNIKEVTSYMLRSGHVKTCGCNKYQAVKKASQKIKESRIDGIVVPFLKSKVRKDNSTGVKGVTVSHKKGKRLYIARISINNDRKYLGTFENLEDAIKARKEAEELYFKPLIERWEGKIREEDKVDV